MTRQHIVNEIKRTAAANGAIPLGCKTFLRETGIKQSDWYGKYWSRWSEACEEAGFTPNKPTQGYGGDDALIEKYIEFARKLGKLPSHGELRLRRRQDSSFPSSNAFYRRLGSKTQFVKKVLEYCDSHAGFEDIAGLIRKAPSVGELIPTKASRSVEIGCVYLLKSGRRYKIGRTNAIGRREYELGTKLPEETRTIHVIPTDDPAGIEAYWHNRFAAKRTRGEWFDLDGSDVQAFKRWKRM